MKMDLKYEVKPNEIFEDKELRAGWKMRYNKFRGTHLDDILADDFNIRNLKRENLFEALFLGLPKEKIMYIQPSDNEKVARTENEYTLWNEDRERIFGKGMLMDIILDGGPYAVQRDPKDRRKISIFDRNGNKVFGNKHVEDYWDPIWGRPKDEGYDKFYFKSPNGNEYIILDEGVFRKDGKKVFGDVKAIYGPMTILEKDGKAYINVQDKEIILQDEGVIFDEKGHRTTADNLGDYKVIKEIKLLG